MTTEGVIKFRAHHQNAPLSDVEETAMVALITWRDLLFDVGLVGQDPARYDGAGYGNLSVRLPNGRVLITGSQTGGIRRLERAHLCVVEKADIAANSVWSRGPCAPSSESMTHVALYTLAPTVGAVVHVHSPVIWQRAGELGLPQTPEEVDYGTPAMASEMARLWNSGQLTAHNGFTMRGHLDGVVTVGSDVHAAGGRAVELLARARVRKAFPHPT